MNSWRPNPLLFFVTVVLVTGCQTNPGPVAGDAATSRAESSARESTPTPAAPPVAGKADAASKANEDAVEPAPKSMSTIELQQRLTKLGYKPGQVDGKMGLRTTNALKKFQHDHKLPVTGTLDVDTILELGMP